MDYDEFTSTLSSSNSEASPKRPSRRKSSQKTKRRRSSNKELHYILKATAIKKVKSGKKSVYDLPLTDLRVTPHISGVYTIGDIIRFIDQNMYIKETINWYRNSDDDDNDTDTDSVDCGDKKSSRTRKLKRRSLGDGGNVSSDDDGDEDGNEDGNEDVKNNTIKTGEELDF